MRALDGMGLKKAKPRGPEGVATTFRGTVQPRATMSGSLDAHLQNDTTAQINARLEEVLHDCGYTFMWCNEANFGGPAEFDT